MASITVLLGAAVIGGVPLWIAYGPKAALGLAYLVAAGAMIVYTPRAYRDGDPYNIIRFLSADDSECITFRSCHDYDPAPRDRNIVVVAVIVVVCLLGAAVSNFREALAGRRDERAAALDRALRRTVAGGAPSARRCPTCGTPPASGSGSCRTCAWHQKDRASI
jgi:hypothetical protein